MPRQFIPVGEILKDVLKSRGLGSGDLLFRIQRNWASAVGEKIAQHACPHMLRDGRLTISVDSPAWMSELSMLSPQIIEKINSGLNDGATGNRGNPPGDAVRELKFRLAGRPAADKADRPASGENAPPIKKRALTLDEKTAVEAATANIQDGELRLQAERMLSNSCGRER